ncbi:MAG: hypothetical protein ACI4DO_04955 [Roseburia sp.]
MKRIRRHKLNNKGASLVTVVATIALVAILVVTVLTISVANIQMKRMYKQSINNFYDAESAMDEIRTGLQQEVSQASTKAYLDVMNSYSSSYNNDTQRQNSFVSKFRSEMTTALQLSGSVGQYDINVLKSYIGVSHRYDDSTGVGVQVVTQSGKTADLEFTTNSICIRNLEVSCMDSDGFYTKVDTDIVLLYPQMNFTQNTSAPDLLSYCMVADQGIHVNNGNRTLKADGNIYAGTFNVTDGGLTLDTDATMELGLGDTLISQGGINLEEGSSFTTGNKTNLWTDNILIKSHATYDVSGTSHVADDLTIQGSGKALLRGEYYGYGNPLSLVDCISTDRTVVESNPSDYSSAIIINGIADTGKASLYLNDLTYLMLAGNAYIGSNGAMMGESLTIKSSQLAYLAPVSCFKPVEGQPQPSNPTTVPASMTNPNMDQLALYKACGVTSQVSSDGLYYYFLKFDNAKDAQDYYQYYYRQSSNVSKLADYLNLYVADRSISVRENRLTTDSNGSILLWDNTGIRSLDPTEMFNSYTDISEDPNSRGLQAEYYDMYSAYNCNLTTDYGSLSLEQTSSTVFNNLISISEIESVVPSGYSRKYSYDNAGFTSTAVVARGDYTYSSSSESSAETIHLIIATGDVTIEKDFDGLIICGGSIKVPYPADTSVSVKSSATEVANLLDLAVYTSGSTDYRLDTIVTDASFYLARLSSTDSGSKQVDMSDYIIYQNWSKE